MDREGTDQIVFEVSGEKEKWEKLLSDRYSMMQEKSATALEKGIWKVALVLDSRQADQIKKSAIDQALRDDSEPDRPVWCLGARDYPARESDRILIQLPGVKDPQRAINLIGQTALLEFKLVDDEGNIEEALRGRVPEGDILLYQRSVDPKTGGVKKIPYPSERKDPDDR